MIMRVLTLGCCFALMAGLTSGQDKKAGGPPDMNKMMELMAKHATPGEAHKVFEKLAGNWTYAGKMYMDPSAPPMDLTGKAERKVIMEGRFLSDHVQGDVPMPFEGRGWSGYDNHKKKYWYVWIDSMSTGTMTAEGSYDPATKTLTFLSEGYDPMEGKVVKGKDVTVIKSNNETHTTYYKLADGKEIKMMEFTYKRAK